MGGSDLRFAPPRFPKPSLARTRVTASQNSLFASLRCNACLWWRTQIAEGELQGHPLAGGPGQSGGYANFHAGVNFRFTEFSWKFDDTPAGLGLHVRGGSKSSMGLPAGSSSRICLPPNPLTMSLRKCAPRVAKGLD